MENYTFNYNLYFKHKNTPLQKMQNGDIVDNELVEFSLDRPVTRSRSSFHIDQGLFNNLNFNSQPTINNIHNYNNINVFINPPKHAQANQTTQTNGGKSKKKKKTKKSQENIKQSIEENLNENDRSDESFTEFTNSQADHESGKRIYTKRMTDKIRRWDAEECDLYEKFLEMYYEAMIDNTNKRNTRIFLLMSKFIRTKTPSQCRSHHQKFFKKVMKVIKMTPEEKKIEMKKKEEKIKRREKRQMQQLRNQKKMIMLQQQQKQSEDSNSQTPAVESVPLINQIEFQVDNDQRVFQENEQRAFQSINDYMQQNIITRSRKNTIENIQVQQDQTIDVNDFIKRRESININAFL